MIQILEGLDALGNRQFRGVIDGVAVNVEPTLRRGAPKPMLGALGPEEARAAAMLMRVGFFVGCAVGVAATIGVQRALKRWDRGGR